ncbi:MAG: DUF4258 domain-containing protein [Defluviitaleaceae bacterium]|nr:DUF4258 domain-containing protein [Defluviitaleaceae bacterium]
MFDIESIRAMFIGNAVKFTEHFKIRLKERGIRYADVKSALFTGEIIEQILDDHPLPSVLIFGRAHNGAPLHIAIGVDDSLAFLLTAYVPSIDIWENDFKTRKVVF